MVDAVLNEDEDMTASSKGVWGSKSLVVGMTVLEVEVEVKILEKLEVVEGEVEVRA